jgi:type I site-specific restriction endonuclease
MVNAFVYITRKDKIDILLEKSGWFVKDKIKVFKGVDTKPSDSSLEKYLTFSLTLKYPDEFAYADNILIDSKNLSIAVIEAKKHSNDFIFYNGAFERCCI